MLRLEELDGKVLKQEFLNYVQNELNSIYIYISG